MSVQQLLGLCIAGAGIVQLLAAVLTTAARGRTDRDALRMIAVALILAVILTTTGVVIASPESR